MSNINEKRSESRTRITKLVDKIRPISEDASIPEATNLLLNGIDAVLETVHYANLYTKPLMTMIMLMATRNRISNTVDKIQDVYKWSENELEDLEAIAKDMTPAEHITVTPTAYDKSKYNGGQDD